MKPQDTKCEVCGSTANVYLTRLVDPPKWLCQLHYEMECFPENYISKKEKAVDKATERMRRDENNYDR